LKSTKVDLVRVLVDRQRKLPKRSMNIAYVLVRAQSGVYHDWESDLDLPKMQLITDLEACRGHDFAELIEEIKRGDYDEEPTVAQIEELRLTVGPEEFDKLFPSKRGTA